MILLYSISINNLTNVHIYRNTYMIKIASKKQSCLFLHKILLLGSSELPNEDPGTSFLWKTTENYFSLIIKINIHKSGP